MKEGKSMGVRREGRRIIWEGDESEVYRRRCAECHVAPRARAWIETGCGWSPSRFVHYTTPAKGEHMCEKTQNAPKSAYICADCHKSMPVPFKNEDDKLRCAACAVDRYMNLSASALLKVPAIEVYSFDV